MDLLVSITATPAERPLQAKEIRTFRSLVTNYPAKNMYKGNETDLLTICLDRETGQ